MTLLLFSNQSQVTPQQLSEWVTDNAFDFLGKGLNEFKDDPKYSIIHFCTGVELFLKARLMKEHWSLIVRNTNNADWKEFVSGKCQTVILDEAFTRLEKIAGEKIPHKKIFTDLADHRNKILHFHHELNLQTNTKAIQSVAGEQCQAWYLLRKLLTDQWQAHFPQLQPKIDDLDQKMRKHLEYLRVIYEQDYKAAIEKEIAQGQTYDTCSSCKNMSAKLITIVNEPKILRNECRVCGYSSDRYLKLKCDCGKDVIFDEGVCICRTCEKKYDIEDVKNILSTSHDEMNISDMAVIDWEFNCSWCDGWHTVIRHKNYCICLSCFEFAERITTCEWFNEGNLGLTDDEDYDSYLFGCSECEGHSGWHAGKDD